MKKKNVLEQELIVKTNIWQYRVKYAQQNLVSVSTFMHTHRYMQLRVRDTFAR